MEKQAYKILVADDEKEIRDILKLLLSEEGYEVVEAENGKAAVDLAARMCRFTFWTSICLLCPGSLQGPKYGNGMMRQ